MFLLVNQFFILFLGIIESSLANITQCGQNIDNYQYRLVLVSFNDTWSLIPNIGIAGSQVSILVLFSVSLEAQSPILVSVSLKKYGIAHVCSSVDIQSRCILSISLVPRPNFAIQISSKAWSFFCVLLQGLYKPSHIQVDTLATNAIIYCQCDIIGRLVLGQGSLQYFFHATAAAVFPI